MDVLGGHGLAPWIAFNALVIVLLAFDLGVVNRKAHAIGFREALFWNIVWTALGVAFAAVVFRLYGRQSALEYLTGYVIERALSIDNIFVFVIVFSYFRVDPRYQHRVLFWGILGALVMRGALIFAGAALVALFHWVLYLFGAFLVYSGVMLTLKSTEAPEPERNPVVRLVRRLLPLDTSAEGPHFFVRHGRRLYATPLLIVLAVVETTDLVFALDSIPAIFGVTQDALIIYSSNVFAILGLRAMYFLLAAMMPRFHFLKHGLSLILVLIGLRMLFDPWIDVPTGLTLVVVCAILAGSVGLSFVVKRPGKDRPDETAR